jgi:hypothetical protein
VLSCQSKGCARQAIGLHFLGLNRGVHSTPSPGRGGPRVEPDGDRYPVAVFIACRRIYRRIYVVAVFMSPYLSPDGDRYSVAVFIEFHQINGTRRYLTVF